MWLFQISVRPSIICLAVLYQTKLHHCVCYNSSPILCPSDFLTPPFPLQWDSRFLRGTHLEELGTAGFCLPESSDSHLLLKGECPICWCSSWCLHHRACPRRHATDASQPTLCILSRISGWITALQWTQEELPWRLPLKLWTDDVVST